MPVFESKSSLTDSQFVFVFIEGEQADANETNNDTVKPANVRKHFVDFTKAPINNFSKRWSH